MTSIAHSSIAEDRYIAHLAGIQGGKETIQIIDKSKAYSAQKHPIRNKIASSIMGLIKGGVITSAGVLAYPLVNSTMRTSILGSTWNVCSACGGHAKSLTDLILNIQRVVAPEKTQSYWEQKATSYGIGFRVGSLCATDDQSLITCRLINYVGGVWYTVSDNYMLLGIVTVGLGALLTYSKMNSYARKEAEIVKTDN